MSTAMKTAMRAVAQAGRKRRALAPPQAGSTGPGGQALARGRRGGQRALALIGGGCALAVALVGTVDPGEPGAATGAPAQVAAAAPAVAHTNASVLTAVERKDRRTRRSGIDVIDGYAFIWGLAGYGGFGGPSKDISLNDPEYMNFAPGLIDGLPQGTIVDLASSAYSFNAVDTDGCVWGWGRFATDNGTGKYINKESWTTPPEQVMIGGRWNQNGQKNAYGEDVIPLCGVTQISASDGGGAAIRADGTVWSWGNSKTGGPGAAGHPDFIGNSHANIDTDVPWNFAGAAQVTGLPSIAEDPTNRPIQIEGGFSTYWLLLANGDVWYFGGDTGALHDWERVAGDEPETYSGGGVQPNMEVWPITATKKRIPVKAAIASGLSKWFRSKNNPEGYIVQVHSGNGFGGALLSTGKILTWGQSYTYGALGRCAAYRADKTNGSCSSNISSTVARSPGFVTHFYYPNGTPAYPKFVGLSAGYTVMTGLTSTGELWVWRMNSGLAADILHWETPNQLPTYLASNVATYQVGEGYVLYWTMDGNMRGIGYNKSGNLGVRGGNIHYGTSRTLDSTETVDRAVWFATESYQGCTMGAQTAPTTATARSGWTKTGNNWYNSAGWVYYSGKYTSTEHVLMKADTWFSKTYQCQVLNNLAKRLTYEQCTTKSIELARAEVYRDGVEGKYYRPCAVDSFSW